MSFNKLMNTVDKLEKSPAPPGVFDISSQLLPVNEVVKNILIIEDNLPKEEAELMVDGFIPQNISKRKSNTQKEIENLKKEGDTKYKNKLIDDSVKDNIKVLSDTDTGAPLSSKSPYHKKAKEILALVKEKVTQFFRKIKELLIEIGVVVVSIASSIPGAALMVSPFAFNVPGMITMLMQMIQLLSMLASKVADLTTFFKYFKYLPLVLSPSNLNSVSSVINSSFQSVNLAFKPLESGINSFLSSSKKTIKSKSKGDKIPRYITARLRKLKYIEWSLPPKGIPPFNQYRIDIKKVSEDDLDEVEEILENWEVVFLKNKKVAVKKKKMLDIEGNEVTIESLLDALDKVEVLFDNIKNNLPDIQTDDFLYDVTFSDGRTLFGITKQEVDGLEVTYNVIYSENVKYSFI